MKRVVMRGCVLYKTVVILGGPYTIIINEATAINATRVKIGDAELLTTKTLLKSQHSQLTPLDPNKSVIDVVNSA